MVRTAAAPRLLQSVLHSNGQSGLEMVGLATGADTTAAAASAYPVLDQVEFHSNKAAVFGYRNAHARLRNCTWRESGGGPLFRIDGSKASSRGRNLANPEHDGANQPVMTVVLRDGATLGYH